MRVARRISRTVFSALLFFLIINSSRVNDELKVSLKQSGDYVQLGLTGYSQFHGIDIKTELDDSTLKRRFLSNPESIKTWKYAKYNFGDDVILAIDTFISNEVSTKSSKTRPKNGAV